MSKTAFKTAYGEREHYCTPTGDGIEPVYAYEINKYGQKELVQVGETNLYEKIQESLEETKIENILRRVVAGDTTVLRPDGIYADISTAPKNLIEARQQIQKLENLWNDLPIDTKREYDMSIENFVNESGSDKWLKSMGLIKEDPKEEAATPKKAAKKAESEGTAE